MPKLLGELRTNEDNEEFRNEPKEDKLDKFVDNDDNVPDLKTEEEALKTKALNKFKDNIDNFDEIVKNKEDKIDKAFKDRENRLNKLNNNVKKIKKYIKENSNKIIAIKKIDYTENERNNYILIGNQLNFKLKGTENELYETKKRLDEERNDVNRKKYINELKEIQERVDYQKNEIKKIEMN